VEHGKVFPLQPAQQAKQKFMTPERYQQVKALFFAVQELEPQARTELLKQSCDGDRELQHAVEELLASSDKVEGFIERPAYAVIAHTLADDSARSSMEGKRIGQYEIVRRLGEGGMGTVYLAQRADDVYKKQVAIKLIRRGFDNSELLRRFYNERQILAGLDHPNIAKLLDGGTTADGVPYYVMDYVVGQPFLDYCNTHDLSNDAKLGLFRTICSAVQHAHQNLIIHRDLKPSNILVSAEGVPKLLDFGIAKVFQTNADGETAEATVTELRVMTPEYASPEQLTGQPITTASDIYSLGVILYQLLTGQSPYRFRSHLPHDIALAICETEPEKPSRASSDARLGQASSGNGSQPKPQLNVRNLKSLRGDLDNIVLMALRKEPKRRYATVEQFSEDIRRHLDGLPVIARRDTFTYRASKFVRRNRYGVSAAAIVLVLLLAGVVAIIRQTGIVTAERDRARTEQVKAERINKFYQDMLARANARWYAPGSGKKTDVTVIDALDEASNKIEHELNDQPEVKAEILTTIGDTYAALGRPDLSQRPFELALNLRRKLFGNNHVKVAESLYYLAGAKSLQNQSQEAEELFKQAIAIQRQRPDEGNNLPYMLLDYGGLLNFRGDRAAAQALFEEALAIFKRRNGPEHVTVAVTLEYLAKLNLDRGDVEKAEMEFREAIKLFGEARNANVARLHERQAQALIMKKDYDQAETHLRRALEMYLLTSAESDWSPTAVKLQFANLICLRGDCRKARTEVENILATQRRLVSAESREMSSILFYVGMMLTKSGEAKRGETYLRESNRIWENLNIETPGGSLSFKNALGECFLEQRRFAEAEPLLVEVYNFFKAGDVPHSPRISSAAKSLNRLYLAWGKPNRYPEG
jgi:eukaryotic-like serine/threonine-protein kinase